MAVIQVEKSPDERGRIRALGLLHGASETLRQTLTSMDTMDEMTRSVCQELYDCVEQEAKNLFLPVQSIKAPPPPAAFSKKKVDTLEDHNHATSILDLWTPMRRRRRQKETMKNFEGPSCTEPVLRMI